MLMPAVTPRSIHRPGGCPRKPDPGAVVAVWLMRHPLKEYTKHDRPDSVAKGSARGQRRGGYCPTRRAAPILARCMSLRSGQYRTHFQQLGKERQIERFFQES